MKPEDIEKVKKVANEFFEKAGFVVNIEAMPGGDQTVAVKIKADDPKVLIGQNGQTLTEIQCLVRAIVRKSVPESFYLDLDINDYKEKKVEYLKEMARDSANEVSLTGIEKIFPPMSSYERRAIHMELANRADIVTESVGLGINRKIVIKPILTN